jgi:phage protein F-like protein|nr:MAG TPA: minor capsid protein [Caudoviricetes sp.]
MPILFYDDLRKANPAPDVATMKMKLYLNAAEPELVYWLQNLWQHQGKAITYKELREAILSGDLTKGMIDAWQQDYSKFVVDYVEPTWLDAMEAANQQLSDKFPLYSFDPMTEGVKQWTHRAGAMFVTRSTEEQIKGLRAVVKKAAQMENMSVDELSHIIRPMVGLTWQQSIANLNYYNTMLASGMPEDKAFERCVRYSARQSRYRGYMIARTELAFAYNKGEFEGIKQAQMQGLMGTVRKVWCTADDERTCKICGGLDGKTIEMDEEFSYQTKLSAKFPGIKKTPPAHPHCRCTVIYEEVEPPQYVSEKPAEPLTPEDKTPEEELQEDIAMQPSVPEDLKIPEGLKNDGKAHLGGTGEMYQYTDSSGREWLFKPSRAKYSGELEPFRAYIQEAGYKVQSIVDPDSAVPVATGTIDGKFGALQKKVKVGNMTPDLNDWYYNGGELSSSIKEQLQRENVTDWLLANYDSHAGNFIYSEKGTIIGVDKEQSFRYLQKKGAQKMSYTFHPNASYGEKPPVYNTMYDRFAKGEIDLDLNNTLPYIKRVEAIPDAEYREIFRSYAVSLNGEGKAAEALLDDIVERKKNLRESFRTFYEELLEERTGKKTRFLFRDEGKEATKQVLAAQTMSKEAAAKLTSTELKKIAKSQGIPNFGNMTKKQLVTCLSDPAQIELMNQEVKAKLAAQASKRAGKSPAPVTLTPKTAKIPGVIDAADLFGDLSLIPDDNPVGTAIFSDRDKVEGLNLTARRINIAGEECYEISGKLTETAWHQICLKLKDANVPKGTFALEPGTRIGNRIYLEDRETAHLLNHKIQVNLESYQVSGTDSLLEVLYAPAGKEPRSQMGVFRIRTKANGDGIEEASRIKDLLKKTNLDFITENPDEQAEYTMKGARLLFQRFPNLSTTLWEKEDKIGNIQNFLDMAGITQEEVNNLKLEKVFDGYSTYVNPGIVKEYQKAGLEYVWSGVSSKEAIVAVYKGGGLQSTNNRLTLGFAGNGASMKQDVESGGADNVFTRIATKGAYKSKRDYSPSFSSGEYQIIMNPKVMERTDWYAYDFDNYGRTSENNMSFRLNSFDFVKKMEKDYEPSNEIMFRHGIPVTEWIGIDTNSEYKKKALIEALKGEGINKINGKSLEKFIRVNSTVGKTLK